MSLENLVRKSLDRIEPSHETVTRLLRVRLLEVDLDAHGAASRDNMVSAVVEQLEDVTGSKTRCKTGRLHQPESPLARILDHDLLVDGRPARRGACKNLDRLHLGCPFGQARTRCRVGQRSGTVLRLAPSPPSSATMRPGTWRSRCRREVFPEFLEELRPVDRG